MPDTDTNKPVMLLANTPPAKNIKVFLEKVEGSQKPKIVAEADKEKLLILTQEELIEKYDFKEQPDHATLYTDLVFASIHLPLLVLGSDFRIKKASSAFYTTFSITETETIGKVLFDMQNREWNIPGLRSQLRRIQTGTEKFIEWEVTHVFSYLGERTVRLNARPFQKETTENRILLSLDDITARKESEKAEKKKLDDLKKILENIPQITHTASAGGSITYFNQFFLEYSGMSFARALKRGLEPLIKPEMLAEFKRSWCRMIETGEDLKMELQLKNKNDDTYRWHLYNTSAIRNDEGIISSWVGTAIDFHDKISREQARDEFMNIASHELRTPLTTAKTYIQLLQASLDETNNKDLLFAHKAVEAIDQLRDLISELLDVSKIQNGKLNLNITTFNFNEMVSAVIEGFQYRSPSHSIVKKGKISSEIKGDKGRLQQVIVNLLENAIKYSPGSGKVIVDMAQKNGFLKVSIKDRGIGIKRGNLSKIFERYYREEERSIHFQGLGIGLYVSYDIIQRHNGKLWAERNRGRGSTFYFTLPI